MWSIVVSPLYLLYLLLYLLLHDAHCHLMSIIDRQVGGDDDVDVRLRSSVDQVCIAADPDLTVEA